MEEKEKVRSGRNRTIVLTEEDRKRLRQKLVRVMGSPVEPGNDSECKPGNDKDCKPESNMDCELGHAMECEPVNDTKGFDFLDKTINSDLLSALPYLPDEFADLIIIDPPYNLTKNFAAEYLFKSSR